MTKFNLTIGRYAILCLCFVLALNVQADPIAVITPGTTFSLSEPSDSTQTRWNRVVLVAKPRISSGDTSKLGETIRRAVSTLSLTILATVNRNDNGTYVLSEVGVGYSLPLRGKHTIVSSETASQLDAGLSLITRHVLSENEKRFEQVRVIARSSTLTIFDTPAILFRGEQHRDYTIRHLCWIDSAAGNGATLVWLLGNDSTGTKPVVEEPMRVIKTGTVEDRGIHVDGDEFMLGIPSDRAFALESLPPGPSVPWPTDSSGERLATLAARGSYDELQLRDLSTNLNLAIAAAMKQAEATQSGSTPTAQD